MQPDSAQRITEISSPKNTPKLIDTTNTLQNPYKTHPQDETPRKQTSSTPDETPNFISNFNWVVCLPWMIAYNGVCALVLVWLWPLKQLLKTMAPSLTDELKGKKNMLVNASRKAFDPFVGSIQTIIIR